MRRKWPVVVLGLLGVITLALVVLAVQHVRPGGPAAVPAEIPTIPSRTSTASPGPDRSATPSGRATATPSGTSTATSARTPRASSVANIKALLEGSEPVKIVVVGDGTGFDDAPTGTDRWVTLWARDLARTRPVTLHQAEPAGGYDRGQELGTGTGARIEVFNASDRPRRLAQVTAEADRVIPADTDLVVFNFGHNEGGEPLDAGLTALREKLPAGSMALVMVQNPQLGAGQAPQQTRTTQVRRWAQQNRLAAVDVNRAFLNDPKPLAELLAPDGINPNAAGSEVWRSAVAAALR